MKQSRLIKSAFCLFLFFLVMCPAFAYSDSVDYLYDDAGRLRTVIDDQSNGLFYQYDEVGNILGITKRTATGTVSITDFDPKEGAAGTIVTIYGKGFSAAAGNNTVKFNGLQASVTAATTTKLTVTTPSNVSTGKITVQVSTNTATSADDFVVALPVASITVQPGTVFLFPGNTQRFTAHADGYETKKVKWSVDGVEGGNYSYGVISQYIGLYFAPSSPSVDEVTITATSLIDPSKSGSARIYLNSAIVTQPVSVAIGSVPAETLVTSTPVSVNISPVPVGSTLSSIPVSAGFAPAVDSLVSGQISIEWPTVSEGTAVSGQLSVEWPTVSEAITVSLPVSVKIGN